MEIRPLLPSDAVAYQALRLRALQESPTAFGNSYEEELPRSIDATRERLVPDPNGSKVTFGAVVDDEIVGALAIVREKPKKVAHLAILGGMYVAPEFRGRGLAGALLDAALAHARSLPGLRQVKLTVTVGNIAAQRLYISRGFVRYGVESDGLCVDGVYYDDEYYLLRLVS